MYKLSKEATLDLDGILDYSLLNFGVDVMSDYHPSLEQCFCTLDQNPDLGLNSDHIRQNYFSFPHRSHIIFYTKEQEGILIIRVLHSSIDVNKHF